MPQRGLATEELTRIWEAAREGQPEKVVLDDLQDRDPKPVRAAYKVFQFLLRRRAEDRPVFVITPGDSAMGVDPVRGIVPFDDFVAQAGVRGYSVKEPSLFRWLAVHHTLSVARDGWAAFPAATMAEPPPATGPQSAHEAMLLQARNHRASLLRVEQPRYLTYNCISGMTAQATSILSQTEEWADLTLEQFQIHAGDAPIWDEIAQWDVDVSEYRGAAIRLAEAFEEKVVKVTGLEAPYRQGAGDRMDPNGPPSLLSWFTISIFEYGWDVAEGVVPAIFRSNIGPFPSPTPNIVTLTASPGNRGAQVAACGDRETMLATQAIQRSLRDELCRSGQLHQLLALYTALRDRAGDLQSHLVSIPADRLMERSCWGCNPALHD